MSDSGGLPSGARSSSTSFLEYAFVRWVLAPAVHPEMATCVTPQAEAGVEGRNYAIDYEIRGSQNIVASSSTASSSTAAAQAFTYDRLRQNDLIATGRRHRPLLLRLDPHRHRPLRRPAPGASASRPRPGDDLRRRRPMVEVPEMDPDPLFALGPSPANRRALPRWSAAVSTYFDGSCRQAQPATLRQCQSEAFAALANYYGSGGTGAACVMSVGAGKTALGVVACLAFARRRAMVVTPGSVIRGTFDQAFDHEALRNVLYGAARAAR